MCLRWLNFTLKFYPQYNSPSYNQPQLLLVKSKTYGFYFDLQLYRPHFF